MENSDGLNLVANQFNETWFPHLPTDWLHAPNLRNQASNQYNLKTTRNQFCF